MSARPARTAWGEPVESTAPPPPVRRILVHDARVGAKWFVPEPDADDAARLLEARFELHTGSTINGTETYGKSFECPLKQRSRSR
jgi:hypothetical protein